MPQPVPASKAKRALQDKGFVEKPQRDHLFFFHYDQAGNKTGAYTYFSGGGRKATQIHAELMGRMRRELHLDSVNQVYRLLACPMSGTEYATLVAGAPASE